MCFYLRNYTKILYGIWKTWVYICRPINVNISIWILTDIHFLYNRNYFLKRIYRFVNNIIKFTVLVYEYNSYTCIYSIVCYAIANKLWLCCLTCPVYLDLTEPQVLRCASAFNMLLQHRNQYRLVRYHVEPGVYKNRLVSRLCILSLIHSFNA